MSESLQLHNLEDLRYPIGRFVMPDNFSREDYLRCVEKIAEAPRHLTDAIADLSDASLDTPYRPNGWTVRQVVHHLPDSHLNAYVRLKWALTEKGPTIKTYDEVEWSDLTDAQDGPIQMSLDLVTALHQRWTYLLRRLTDDQRTRTITHPEWGAVTVDYLTAQYAWHGEHHVAQITNLRKRKGW